MGRSGSACDSHHRFSAGCLLPPKKKAEGNIDLLLFFFFLLSNLTYLQYYLLYLAKLMMKNERVLHMLPPHSLGLSSYLPPTASPTTNNFFFFFFMSLHNINGRRRPTVWDLSGSFIYNFFFFLPFLRILDFVDASARRESLLVQCGRLYIYFQPTPHPFSCLLHNLEIIFRSSFLCLFIYLFKTIFVIFFLLFLPLPCSVIIMPSKVDLLFFLFSV